MKNGLKYIFIATILSGLYVLIFIQISQTENTYQFDKPYYLNYYKASEPVQDYVEIIKNDANRMVKIKEQSQVLSKNIPDILIATAEKELKEVDEIIIRIKNDKSWFENVKKQAKEQSVSESEMLKRSAVYVIRNRMNNE